jgi:hypothetical protein
MNPEIHERIRQRAYELWEAAGRVLGKDLEYWLQAEKDILAEISSTVGKAIAPQTKKVAKFVKPKTARKTTAKPKTAAREPAKPKAAAKTTTKRKTAVKKTAKPKAAPKSGASSAKT